MPLIVLMNCRSKTFDHIMHRAGPHQIYPDRRSPRTPVMYFALLETILYQTVLWGNVLRYSNWPHLGSWYTVHWLVSHKLNSQSENFRDGYFKDGYEHTCVLEGCMNTVRTCRILSRRFFVEISIIRRKIHENYTETKSPLWPSG